MPNFLAVRAKGEMVWEGRGKLFLLLDKREAPIHPKEKHFESQIIPCSPLPKRTFKRRS